MLSYLALFNHKHYDQFQYTCNYSFTVLCNCKFLCLTLQIKLLEQLFESHFNPSSWLLLQRNLTLWVPWTDLISISIQNKRPWHWFGWFFCLSVNTFTVNQGALQSPVLAQPVHCWQCLVWLVDSWNVATRQYNRVTHLWWSWPPCAIVVKGYSHRHIRKPLTKHISVALSRFFIGRCNRTKFVITKQLLVY